MSKRDHAVGQRCRRRRRLRFLLGLVQACGLWVAGASSPGLAQENDSLRTVVAQALEDLGADSLAVREGAERRLLELGPEALAFLGRPTEDTAPERRERWERVRQQLEAAAAVEAVAPSRVSLAGNLGPDEALAVIAAATGNPFEPTQSDRAAVTFDLQRATYWEAIDAWLRAFPDRRLSVPRGSDARLRTTAAVSGELLPPSVVAGAFRIEIVRVETLKDFGNPDLDGTVVTARVRWEPRLRPVTITHDLERLEAQAGESRLKSRMGIASYESSVVPGRGGVDVRWVLDPAARDKTQIDKLAGVMKVRLPTRPTEVTFLLADVTTPQSERVGATVVGLQRVDVSEDSVRVAVRIRFDDAQGTLESHRGWIFESPAQLLTAAGATIEPLDFETDRQAADEVGIIYRFPKIDSLEGVRFRTEVPAAVVSTEVPFEIRSIPLP